MRQLICDDCKYATSGPTRKVTWCPLLKRTTEADGPCQVSREGLLRQVRQTEPLRDEADALLTQTRELHQRHEDLQYKSRTEGLSDAAWRQLLEVERKMDDAWGTIDRNMAEVDKWKDVLRELWIHARQVGRECPRCDFIPLDSRADDCPDCGSTLLLKPKKKVRRSGAR